MLIAWQLWNRFFVLFKDWTDVWKPSNGLLEKRRKNPRGRELLPQSAYGDRREEEEGEASFFFFYFSPGEAEAVDTYGDGDEDRDSLGCRDRGKKSSQPATRDENRRTRGASQGVVKGRTINEREEKKTKRMACRTSSSFFFFFFFFFFWLERWAGVQEELQDGLFRHGSFWLMDRLLGCETWTGRAVVVDEVADRRQERERAC
ncbi:hypothetical protein D8B26_003213 [Coccidioides posadasii str. Silveira]|uniref:uncharacterized protein n=1 Tax=Coccidioides posadasii (strain RMSCC 757 / Silveira) TaxID=443226 RepID=UPI001BEEEFD8|nr:hypothetical protein D8B26_003213 [Coccidioides posadasii str. Silveira]